MGVLAPPVTKKQIAPLALFLSSFKAPNSADPLKAWGDLLAREGQWKAALAKYDEALKYAPAWVELHQARDAAARRGLTLTLRRL